MIDKNCILQIFGGLMQHPQYLGQVDKYSFNVTDFQDLFFKRIFSGIYNLYADGANTIHPIDVENALALDSVSATIFKERNGIAYLNDAIEMSDSENFDYYYKRFKKINLLNDLAKSGFDISQFYCEDISNSRASEINSKFDSYDLTDIVEAVKKNIMKVTTPYVRGDVTESSNAYDGMEELLEQLAEGSELGEPIQGEIFNQIVGGATRGKLYIRSAGSGTGKTRQSVGDACYLAYPCRFNPTTYNWERSGNNQKVLFIATEQSKQEVQRMILAYLTGINESKFKYGQYTTDEQERIQKALWIMKKFKDNFIITRMPNPTIELVKTIVRENVLIYGCEYVFYDYIFIGPSLINEFKGVALRNDRILSYI